LDYQVFRRSKCRDDEGAHGHGDALSGDFLVA
jgi:hypothetical protein